MQIKDVMTRRMWTVSPTDSLRQAAELMRVHDIGFLPVTHGTRVVGAITDRDLVIRGLAAGLPPESPVASVMTEDVVYCLEDDPVGEAITVMEEEGVRRLLVLTGKMDLAGVVSLEDLAAIPGTSPEVAETLARLS